MSQVSAIRVRLEKDTGELIREVEVPRLDGGMPRVIMEPDGRVAYVQQGSRHYHRAAVYTLPVE